MTTEDELEFIKLVYSQNGASITKDIPQVPTPSTGFHNIDDYMKEFHIKFKDKCNLLIRVIDFETVSFIIDPDLITRIEALHLPTTHMIGYDRSIIKDGRITEGELVFLKTRIDIYGNKFVADKRITKFYSKLARWIRNNGVKASYDGKTLYANTYILPGALEFYKNGGKLGKWWDKQLKIEDGSFKPLESK